LTASIFKDYFPPRITRINTNCTQHPFSNSCQLAKLVKISCFQSWSGQFKFIVKN